MWIIKIGGSWIKNQQLNKLIELLHRFSKFENIVIVAGGGCFSDSVRGVFSSNMMSEKTGHFLALKYGKVGEKYILGGENLDFKDFLDCISEFGNMPKVKIRLNPNYLMPFAYLNEIIFRLFGKSLLVIIKRTK